ncbi:hypothetical protein PAXINDRAFT_7896 [Paxillus involutus ATCC 200175]|nr:hypothetical protein PAXINDRAFT_7896 [Paxillus involutus ATCC 200175]
MAPGNKRRVHPTLRHLVDWALIVVWLGVHLGCGRPQQRPPDASPSRAARKREKDLNKCLRIASGSPQSVSTTSNGHTANPENERLQVLAEINTSRAPVSVLNVRPGQPVEVIFSKGTGEDYEPEKRAFSGSGNRLGFPVPADTPSASMPGAFPAATSAGAATSAANSAATRTERSSLTTMFEADPTQPMTTIQII